MAKRDRHFDKHPEREPKVHLFKDWGGATYDGKRGTKQLYANTLCKGNMDPNQVLTTYDVHSVTCQTCLKKMDKNLKVYHPPSPRPFLSTAVAGAADAVGEQIRESIGRFVKNTSGCLTDEARLDEEIEHANQLAASLRYAIDHIAGIDDGEGLHVIAVVGTQITVGDLLRGSLARHDALRQIEGYR